MSSPAVPAVAVQPEVSVVVCTYNRANLLTQALGSLLQQQTRGRRYEIVIIDDGSTDNTSAVVTHARSLSSIAIRYVRQANGGIGNARNRGIKEARAPWIAFFDDDQVATEEWLFELLDTAETTGADCVGGPALLKTPEQAELEPIGTISMLLGQNPCMVTPSNDLSLLDRLRARITRLDHPGGGNALIRATLLKTLGGFRPIRFGEDLDLFRRAAKEGAIFAVAHSAIIYQLVPAERLTSRYLYSLATRAGTSQASLDEEEPGAMRPYIMAVLRLIHLIMITLPSLVWHAMLRHKSHFASNSCSLRFASAYIGQVIRKGK